MKNNTIIAMLLATILTLAFCDCTNANITSWPNSSSGSANSVTNLSIANTLFVDVVNGSNATALRGRLDKPSLTLSNAVGLSQAGDLVQVWTGRITNSFMLTSNANYNFSAGSFLGFDQTVFENTSAMFSDWAHPVTNYISGYSQFVNNSISDFFEVDLVSITNPASVFSFVGESITQTNFLNGGGFNQGGALFNIKNCAYVNIKIKKILMTDDGINQPNAAFIWGTGEMSVDCDTLETSLDYGIVSPSLTVSGVPITADTWFSYTGKTIRSHANQYPVWDNSLAPNNGRLAINVALLSSDLTACAAFEGGGPVTYITALKENGGGSVLPVIAEFNALSGAGTATNILFNTAQKMTSTNTGGLLIMSSRSTLAANSNTCMRVEMNVQTYEVITTNYTVGFKVDQGQLIVNGGVMTIPNGRGLNLTGGSVTLNNVTMNTTNTDNVTNCAIFKTGGGALTINGGNYIVGSTANSINATNAQTVFINGANFNQSFSTNITAIGAWTINGTYYSSSGLNFNSNPHLPVAVTLTGSAFRYTNSTPNVLECYFSGSVAYAVTKNNVGVFGSLAGDGYFLLQPTNQCVITYTVAPTFFTNSMF